MSKSDQKEGKNRDEKEDVLLHFKRSRKAFLTEYFSGFLLLLLVVVLYMKGIILPKGLHYFVVGFALFSIVSAEFSRLFLRYKITSTKIVIISGLIKQDKKNVYYHPLGFLPDINTKQGRLQRLLNYGTIFVDAGGNSFEIKDVNSPHKVMGMLEGLIGHDKKKEPYSV
tara:strand:- start:201 stop:707 length:507 start_codon:yes stop_codon:yes gene_type:complete